MRKWFMIALMITLMLLVANAAPAQQWTTANQVTVSWDPVTTNIDGQPITGTVTYKTYSKPELGTIETLVGTVSETKSTITFTAEGRYFLGVKSVRNVDGVEIESSRIAWSNVASDCQNGVTFGVQFYKAPANVKNIKLGP
jgi:hypothetical protein